MLDRLGDFIGNGQIDPTRPGSLGVRCDLIGDIKDLLDSLRPPLCAIHNDITGVCGEPVVWDLAGKRFDGRYVRIESVCDRHVSLRVVEFYEGCDMKAFPDEDFAQIRPYNPDLPEND
jgi:hypothetical protein